VTTRIVIRPLAADDIVHQARYIQQESGPLATARFFKAVERTFALLAANPGMGRVTNFEAPWLAGMRMFRVSTFKNHLVFYRNLSGALEVVRLLHGARDIETLLDG
jgi:toxin ParE1/3/4